MTTVPDAKCKLFMPPSNNILRTNDSFGFLLTGDQDYMTESGAVLTGVNTSDIHRFQRVTIMLGIIRVASAYALPFVALDCAHTKGWLCGFLLNYYHANCDANFLLPAPMPFLFN